MVLFNYATKELTAKVVYYGPGLCGKTTNLQWVHEKVPIKNKGKMLSLSTETDRTLFFDFLPIELGLIRGMRTRIQLYTVPGQVFYNATRRMVLKGADAVVFVADSQEAMIDADIESQENLRQNLEANEIDPNEVPMVLQYNKRDLPNALPIEILNERLNPRNLPHFEAMAIHGVGVEETLKAVTGLVFRSLAGKYGAADDRSTTAPEGKVPASAPAPAPVAAPRPPSRPVTQPAVQSRAAEAVGHPPLNMRAASRSDELVDSLELQATAESEDNLLVDEMDVEEIAFDEGPPRPSPAPARVAPVAAPPRPAAAPARAATPVARADPRTTVASTPQEAEEIRSLIRPRRPVAPVGPDPEPLGAALFAGLEQPAASVPASAAAPASAPAAVRPVSRVDTIPPAPAAAAPAVAVADARGTAEVTVPIKIAVDAGTTQINLHLKLLLQVRPPR
jgi:signal recognition particle receptor subunit beta